MPVREEPDAATDATPNPVLDQKYTFERFQEHFKASKIIPRYDSTKESKIPHNWWKLDHDLIYRFLNDISITSTAVMVGVDDDDTEVQHLHKKGSRLRNAKRSKTMQVTISGPQGPDKSSFLNALLDCPGLGTSGSDGQACVNAIVRYVHCAGTGGSAVMAKVKFLRSADIDTKIQKLARAFHEAHQDEDVPSHGEAVRSRSETRTRKEIDGQAKHSAQKLLECFYGSTEELFRNWSSEAFESGDFQRDTARKCHEALRKIEINADRITYLFAKTPEQLSASVQLALTKVNGHMVLWPLVESIQYGIDCAILKQGYEFIDIPGWIDQEMSDFLQREGIMNTADMEMIVIDASHVSFADFVINKVRKAMQDRGTKRVIIIATKIDSMTQDDCSNCNESGIDKLKIQIEETNERIVQAIQAGPNDKYRDLCDYRIYLKRERNKMKVLRRRQMINQQFQSKATNMSGTDEVKMFCVSSKAYLKWLSRPKLPFALQANLPPDMTGLPDLRKYLHHSLAPHHFKELRAQVFSEVNSYLEQIHGVTKHDSKFEDAKILASRFHEHRGRLIKHLTEGTSELRRRFEEIFTTRDTLGDAHCRQRIDTLVSTWYDYSHSSFNKILQYKGTLPANISQTKSLECGCNWNKDLSDEFVTSFTAWKRSQDQLNEVLQVALCDYLRWFDEDIIRMMEHSRCNDSTIATARDKWTPYKDRLLNQVEKLIHSIQSLQLRLLIRGLMSDDRPNSLVPEMMERIYQEVYDAVRPTPVVNSNGKRLRIPSKFSYQKQRMSEMLLSRENHIFDNVIGTFATAAQNRISYVLDTHINQINNILESFSQQLHDLPTDHYNPSPQGEKIRAALRTMLPDLHSQAMEMQKHFPPESDEFNEHEVEKLAATIGPSHVSRDFIYFIDMQPGSRPKFSVTS